MQILGLFTIGFITNREVYMKDLQIAIDFIEGRTTVEKFMREANVAKTFEELQELLPKGASRCVQQIKEGKIITLNVAYDVKSYLNELFESGTLDAKVNIFAEVRDILLSKYQDIKVDNSIIEKFQFILVNTPSYIGGAEAERTLEQIYDRLVDIKPSIYKAEVKKQFCFTYKPPRWIQAPEWPVSENGTPLQYLYERKKSKEVKEYFFKNIKTDSIAVIEQSF